MFLPLPDDRVRERPVVLELWGGHECTVNRVGDQWFDQTIRSGHQDRIEDLELFADTGIRKLRYPVLWERISPHDPSERDFRWTDERLAEIRRLGMAPIATLCHHGSGPHYTSLVEDSFATGLAQHARAVAERYPWICDYTPVNEPLTTARFSALYGFWYPHARDEGMFWRALLNEIDATRLAMREIRHVNPAARLIQTDDLGFCHATEPLQAEADFQNDRRWAGWDLLCGMVVPGHPLWTRLARFGLEERLRAIAHDPCPPDVIGINHYLSSERLLDHRLELHATRSVADNAVGNCNGIPHVDVDAARSMPDQVIGLAGLVEQAWRRYRLPVAITECHNGSTREEQARWFVEAWEQAEKLQLRGVDVRAVTAWALLGSHDWNRMVTCVMGHYEPGVYDVRAGVPRPTMMAGVLKALSSAQTPGGPALHTPGWWRKERRQLCRPGASAFASSGEGVLGDVAPVLAIVGDDGPLTALAVAACEARGLHYALVRAPARATSGARRWAVLDLREDMVRDQAGVDRLARYAEAFGARSAFVTRDPSALEPARAGLLKILVDDSFAASDEDALPVSLLDLIDAGLDPAPVSGDPWRGIYAPSLIDCVLDLLLDGAEGPVCLRAGEGLSEADLAGALMHVSTGQPGPLPIAARVRDAGDWSYLPPLETMFERFIADRRRLVRSREGEAGRSLRVVAAE